MDAVYAPLFRYLSISAGLIFRISMYNRGMKDNEKKEGPMRLYSTEEVVSMWGISRWRIYDLVKSGKIRPIVNMGKGWKFDGSEFDKELLERL